MTTPVAPRSGHSANARSRSDGPGAERSRQEAPPARWELRLRPLGYAGLALVYAAIALIILFVLALLPTLLEDTGSLADSPGVTTLRENPSELLAFAVAMPLMILMFGYVAVLLLGAFAVLTVLALTYAVRALRPGYAGERLSATGWTRDALGTATVYPSAMSLLPRRMTPWTRFWLKCYVFTYTPTGGTVVGSTPAGAAYLLAVICVCWPVTDPLGTAVWLTACAALLCCSVVLLRRAWVRREERHEDADRQ